MTGSSYQLSCSEQHALKKRLEAALRVQRLKEVRAQDRQLAKQRARAYQELCVDSAQQLQQQLIELITQQREQELACLKAQYEEALAGLASAQEHAAETEQQRALQAQRKQQLYLQRQSEAQARFNAALTQVRNARQSELQAVLEQVQRRQDIMLQERGKARGFAEQAKEAALRQAQQHAELNLQEEQRRRQNQVSRIDFRYSRLHDLGPPHLVVNHRDLPQVHGADGASQAQAEAARLQEEKQAQAQQQEENARRAADRGVSAQKLLQAEQNRRRMEQALQELEGNALQQRKHDLVPDKLAAAPLLRKWHKQKLQAKARSAFERDFLQAPVSAGLPSFVRLDDSAAVDTQPQEGQGQAVERPRSPAHQAAAAANRALKLVQQLERQRKAEASAAAVERQQQQQEAARRLAVAQSLSTEDSEVPVEDLMTCIPPVSSAGSQQLSHAAAASTGIGSESLIPDIRSSAALTELLQGDQEVSASAVLPSTSAALDGQASPPSVDSAAPESLVQADLQLSQPDDSSVAAALLEASRTVQPSTIPGAESSAATLAEATAGEATVLSSKDSLDAIIAAADEVLRQLPAEMQAAAAARAAAAAQPAQRTLTTQQGPADSSTESFQLSDAVVASQAAHGNMQQQQQEEEEPAPDSSADAAAILAELRSLQQQLGVQVLPSESSDSALAELQSFDADIDQRAAKQMRAPLPRVGSRPTPPPAAASQAAAGGSAAARATTSSASVSADAAAISAGLSAALASARQQLQGAAGSAAWEQQPHQPVRTELDDLIDRILAPEYPSNMLSGPLAGPVPSISSPTRPAGRTARRAAAGDVAGLRQGTAAAARPLAAQLTAGAGSAARAGGRDAAAAAAAVGDSRAHSADADLVEKLKALGMDLQALGVSGMAAVSNMLNSSSGGGSSSGGLTSGSISSASLEPTGPPEALAALRASLAASSSTSLTLPTTILQGAGAQHPQQQATRLPPRPPQMHQGPTSSRSVAAGDDAARQRVSAVSVSTSAPSLSGLLQRAQASLAAAAAGHPAAASAAAAGLLSSVSATSDSSWSLSASQEASLMTLEQMLRAEAPAAPGSSSGGSIGLPEAAAAAGRGPADVAATAPSSIVSLPSTLLRTAGGVAASTLTQASQAGSRSAAPAAVGGHSAVQQAAAMQQQEDPYALLRDLLSLSGSSSPETPRSPRQHAAAAAAAPQRPVGLASGPVTSSFSSAISSMSDSELEQLLQKAMAAATQGSGAVSTPLAEAAVSSGAAGAVQSGNIGSIEAALEAMLAAAGATNAAAAVGGGSVGFDQASASTTLPSTIMRGMQPPTRQQPGQGQVQGGPAVAAGAVGGVEAAAAASALQRAKCSSRARAAEAASGSLSSGSADSGSSGSAGDSEPSSGDLSSGSSNSLSIQQARGPGQHYEHHTGVSSSYQPGLPTGVPAGASSSIGGYAASGSGSSTLSLPSTVHNVTAAVSQPGATAVATAAAGQSDVEQQRPQQRSHVAEQCWDRDGMPLDPIHEEDETSSSSASGLLSTSTQEINALLARLAQEHMQPHQQLSEAAGAAVAATSSSDSGASGTISGTSSTGLGSVADVFAAEAAGGAAGASSSSRQDGVMSSDSFSEVVSSLMLHIDSTIGALAAGSGGGSAQAAPGAAAVAAAGQHGASSAAPAAVQSPQQVGHVSYLLQDEVSGFSFGAGSSSAGSYNTPAGLAPAGALRATAGGSAAAASGGASSSSAAPGSVGVSSSSVSLSGINSDTPTDSSTQRYVQQLLMGIMSSSSAATGTTASPDWDSGSSRRHPDPSNRPTGAPASSAAAATRSLAAALPGQVAAAGGQTGSSRQRMQAAGLAGTAGPFVFDTPRQLSGQPARQAAGGLLSPESTAESSLGSSGDTEQLLEGLSSGSLVIGPSSSSSSSAGSAVQQQPAAAGQGANRAHGRHQQAPMQPAGPSAAAPVGVGAAAAAALEQAEVHIPSGTPATSITAISSALKVAAETRGVGGPSSGGFLSPDGSSASESSSSKRLQTANTGAAAAGDGAASCSAAAEVTVPLRGHLPRPVAGIPLPSAQQQRHRAGLSEPQWSSSVHSGIEQQPMLPTPLQRQQQQVPPVASVGLGELLAEIIADDPDLLQQQRFDRQQH